MKSTKLEFTNYTKRIWDFKHEGTDIHLVFKIFESIHHGTRVDLVWSCSKYKGIIFRQGAVVGKGHKRVNWRKIFERLRLSLSYGLNPVSRDVTDRVMGKDSPRFLHQKVLISGKAQ